jgi:hypoxanthine phosphoribosyltransferase
VSGSPPRNDHHSQDIVLYTADDIAARVNALARAIAKGPLVPDLVVPILVGAFVFASDLMRALARESLSLETEFVWLRAYGRNQSAGDVTVLKPPGEIVRGRKILLVDGVLESGATAARARQLLLEAGASDIRFAVAVKKPHAAPAIAADHFCFEAGPEFLFGYGMDLAGEGRGLPDIRIRKNNDRQSSC